MRLFTVSFLLAFTLSASAADLRVEVDRNGFTGPIDVVIAPRVEGAAPQWSAVKTIERTTTFNGVAEGLYVVMLKGPQPLQRLSAKVNVGSDGATLRLAIPKRRTSLRVTLAGRAIARATVELTHEELRWTTELQTGDDGRFEGALWEPGAYDAAVWKDRAAAPHIVAGGVTLSAKPLAIDIPDRVVAGRVTGEDGKPVAGATVFLRTQDDISTMSLRAGSGSDGRFEFFGVREGSHTLVARAPSYLDSDAVAFELAGKSAHRSVDLALAHGVQRPVRVIDHRGEPVADASLFAACDGNVKSTATTNAAGRAQVALPREGTCTVYAIPQEGSIAVSPVWGNESLILRVPEGSSSLRLALAAENGADFAGVWLLMRVNGMVVPPAVARRLVNRGLRLITDGDGAVTLAHIPPGSYEFWPYQSDLEGQMLYEGANTISAPIALDVAAGENRAKVRLRSRR